MPSNFNFLFMFFQGYLIVILKYPLSYFQMQNKAISPFYAMDFNTETCNLVPDNTLMDFIYPKIMHKHPVSVISVKILG